MDGHDPMPPELREAAERYFRGKVDRAQRRGRGRLLPRARDGLRGVHGRLRDPQRPPAGAERGGRRGRRRQPRRDDPVRERRPRAGPTRAERAAAADRRPRRAGLQVPPQHPGVLPERPDGLPALRGDRRGRPAGPLPHRPQRHRLGRAGRRRAAAQVLEPDLRRRRGGRLPRDADRARPPVVPLAGRGALDRDAQAGGPHRPLRLVAEVLPAPAGPVRQHAAQAPGPVRLGLPDDHAGPLAARLRAARHRRRGAAADPQGERRPPA